MSNELYLWELQEKLSRIASLRSNTALTNVIDVATSPDYNGVEFSFAENDKDETIKDLQTDLEKAEEDLATSGGEIDKLEESLEKAENLLSEIKDGDKTLMDYKKEAKAADERSKNWRVAYEEMKGELTAMRKRKGVEFNIYKNMRGITKFIRASMEKGRSDQNILDAKALYSKLTEK